MADTRETLKEFGVLPGQPPVEQAGGVPTLELTLSSPATTLDADYAETRAEIAAEFARDAERAATAEAARPTPQSTLFPAPEKPSAIAAGMEAGGRAASEGVRSIVDGLRALVRVGPSTGTANVLNLPQKEQGAPVPDPMQALRGILVEGLIGVAMSPLVAAFGAAGQGLENLSPEMANQVVFEGGAAFTFNHLLSGAPATATIPPEQAEGWKQPVTVRSLIETLGPLLPVAKPAVKKVGLAAEIQRPNLKSERGSMGSGKRVYHGGPDPISTVDKAKLGSRDRGLFGPGFYVTESPATAKHFGDQVSAFTLPSSAKILDVGTIHPGYETKVEPKLQARIAASERAFLEGAKNTKDRPDRIQGYLDLIDPTKPEFNLGSWIEAVNRYAEANGFDAIKFSPNEIIVKNHAILKSDVSASLLGNERGSIGPRPEPSEFQGGPKQEGAGAPPPTAGAAPTAGESRLNTARMNVEADVKQVAARVNALQAEKLAASRKTQTHAETIEAGEALHLTVEQALALDPLTVPLGEAKKYQQALRDLHASAATHLADIGKRAMAGEKGLDAQGWAAFDLAGELSIKQEVTGTEGGRIVEARKIGAEASRSPFDPEEFQRVREQTAGAPRGDFSTMARRLAALPGGVKGGRARTFIRQTWEMAKLGKDMAHELWINALLTNPVTHAANVTGTFGTTLWELPERATAEILHRLFSSNPEGVQRGETAAMLRAGVGALRDGFRLAGKSLQAEANLTATERALLGRTKVEFTRQTSAANVAERMGWNPETAWGKAVDALGTAANVPVTALAFEDAVFKGINYRMELGALAVREARAEGLTGAAFSKRVKELEVNPSAPMMLEAVDAAMVRTLNAELGPAGQLFMQWANKFPMGRVVAPFIRTPTNSFKWFGQRAPILAQLSAKNWSDMMTPGAAREKAIARQAIGLAFTAVIAYEVSQGNITGGGPSDKGLRKLQRDPKTTTKPVYSFKAGDDYYNLSRIDPMFGSFVGAIADYIELASQIPTQEGYGEWAAYGEALGIAAGHLVVNKTWAQGAANLLDAIQDPDRNLGKVVGGLARSTVPAGVRQFTRTQMDDNIVREVRGITEAIKSGLPYFVNQVPVDRNPVTGEAVEYPPGWGPDMVSPITVTQKSDSAVFKEIQANKIHLSPVPRALGGTEMSGPLMTEQRPGPPIPLSAEQRDYWRLAMTQHVKRNGMNLYEALDDLVQSERYQRLATGPGGGRELLFKTVYHAYKQAGFKMLYDASPQIREAFRAQKEARGAALLPVTDPRSPQYGASPGSAEALIQSLSR